MYSGRGVPWIGQPLNKTPKASQTDFNHLAVLRLPLINPDLRLICSVGTGVKLLRLALRLQGSLGQSNHWSANKSAKKLSGEGLAVEFLEQGCAFLNIRCQEHSVSFWTCPCTKCSNARSFPNNRFISHSGSCLSSQLLVVVAHEVIKSNGVSHTHTARAAVVGSTEANFFSSFAFDCTERQSVVNFYTFLLGSQKRETEGRFPGAEFSWSSMTFEAVSPPPAFIVLLEGSQCTLWKLMFQDII